MAWGSLVAALDELSAEDPADVPGAVLGRPAGGSAPAVGPARGGGLPAGGGAGHARGPRADGPVSSGSSAGAAPAAWLVPSAAERPVRGDCRVRRGGCRIHTRPSSAGHRRTVTGGHRGRRFSARRTGCGEAGGCLADGGPGCRAGRGGGWWRSSATPSPPEEHRAGQEQRRSPVDDGPGLGGMVALDGWLNPEQGATRGRAGPVCARPGRGDRRGAPCRRAEALVELARRTLDRGDLPEQASERPHLIITAPLERLVGRPGATPVELDQRREPSPPSRPPARLRRQGHPCPAVPGSRTTRRRPHPPARHIGPAARPAGPRPRLRIHRLWQTPQLVRRAPCQVVAGRRCLRPRQFDRALPTASPLRPRAGLDYRRAPRRWEFRPATKAQPAVPGRRDARSDPMPGSHSVMRL